eukprot:SAG11_NODE_15465_length_577_cov_0.974895_1_plen_28_part_10
MVFHVGLSIAQIFHIGSLRSERVQRSHR